METIDAKLDILIESVNKLAEKLDHEEAKIETEKRSPLLQNLLDNLPLILIVVGLGWFVMRRKKTGDFKV